MDNYQELIERAKNALPHMMNYQQADADGVMVLVSRQAIDEVAAGFEALQARVSELTRDKKEMAANNDRLFEEWRKEYLRQ